MYINSFGRESDPELVLAKRLWAAAQRRFDNADSVEMTNLAIYDIAAAKRRYMVVLTKHRTVSAD